MGWAYCGKDDRGREIGYGIEATCDKKGCDEVIDRGLGCVCGPMHGGDEGGCGRYFCEVHSTFLPCGHRFKGAYGATICQPMKGGDGKIWCACGFNHHVEWPAEQEDMQTEHEELNWDECTNEDCDYHEEAHANAGGSY